MGLQGDLCPLTLPWVNCVVLHDILWCYLMGLKPHKIASSVGCVGGEATSEQVVAYLRENTVVSYAWGLAAPNLLGVRASCLYQSSQDTCAPRNAQGPPEFCMRQDVSALPKHPPPNSSGYDGAMPCKGLRDTTGGASVAQYDAPDALTNSFGCPQYFFLHPPLGIVQISFHVCARNALYQG